MIVKQCMSGYQGVLGDKCVHINNGTLVPSDSEKKKHYESRGITIV